MVGKKITLPQRNSAIFLIRDKLIENNPLHIVKDPFEDFYYGYISKYILRFKLDAASQDHIDVKKVLTTSSPIVGMLINEHSYLIVNTNQKIIMVFDLYEPIDSVNPFRSLNTSLLTLANGDSGAVTSFMTVGSRIYFTTIKTLWYSDNYFTNVTKDNRFELIGSDLIDLRDNKQYQMDGNDTLFYLHQNRYIYGLEKERVLAMSPTRYADGLLFVENEDSLTKEGYLYEGAGEAGKNIIYSCIEEPSYLAITSEGKARIGDIITGTWEKTVDNLTGGNTCTSAYYDKEAGVLYLATYNGIVYHYAIDTLLTESSVSPQVLQATDMGSIYAMLIHKKRLYMGGYIGRVSVYDIEHASYHPYNEYSVSYATNVGNAIGNVNIRAMALNGETLVVGGNAGRLASCNLVTKRWTRFNGVNELDETPVIDSPYFNNGTALGNFDITALVFYFNKYLIIFGVNGRIASFDIQAKNWTDYTGTPLNPLLATSPIHDTGTHSNGRTVRSAILTDVGVVMGSDGGLLSSLTIDGGITKYNHSDVDLYRPGPGISFDGYNFDHTLFTLSFDTIRGNILFAGSDEAVGTYNLNEQEVLLPYISKLYYTAHRNTVNDYLSSLLVELSKETLEEKRVIYPPREDKNAYEDFYDAASYVYKHGKIVYKLASDLDYLSVSVDGGENFASYLIGNKSWPEAIENTVVENIKGFIADDGTFGLYALINNISYLLFSYTDGSEVKTSWHRIEGKVVKDFGLLTSAVPEKYMFYVVGPYEYGWRPSLVGIVDGQLYLHDIFTMLSGDSIHLSMDAEGNVYAANEGTASLYKMVFMHYGLIPILQEDPTAIIADHTQFMKQFFNARKLGDYLKDDAIYAFLGFAALANQTFNYFYAATNGNIIVVTITVDKGWEIVIHPDTVTNNRYWSITYKEILAREYLTKNDYNPLENSYRALSEIAVDKAYFVFFDNHIKGLLGLNVSYTETAVGESASSRQDQHVVISLDASLYKNHFTPEYRVYKHFQGKGMYVTHDRASRELILASYQDTKGISVRTIYKIESTEAIPHTPLRALTDTWYNQRFFMHNDINAVRIRAKFAQIEDDASLAAIDKQFAFRYEVLITNETNGAYILYEAEKTMVNARFDPDTKTPNVLLKVKAIDGFEDDLIELYASRFAGRQVAFVKTENLHGSQYVPKAVMSYDFTTIFQLGKAHSIQAQTTPFYYSIKVRPVSALPSTVDVQFYLEAYKNVSLGVNTVTNNLERSEFKAVTQGISEYQFGERQGFLIESLADMEPVTGNFGTGNHELLPRYGYKPPYERKGFADTLVAYIKGRGEGRYDRVDGIVSNQDHAWTIVPFSVNRKPVAYSFDAQGTKYINDTFDMDFLKNGRNISKMHEFGVFTPSVINIADYYVDLKDTGRIVKSEGILSTPYGQFEGIGTMDGRQKRITGIHEAHENGMYRYLQHGLDEIRGRLYGYAYDFIDRYSVFEIPYYYMRSWWIPARGYITRSNDSLLSFDNDASHHINSIGKALFPFEFVSPPPHISKPNVENEGGGIGSGGIVVDPDTVAFSTLIKEKYPLTHWEGFNDLDFVRFYRDVYVDGHELPRTDIEPPYEIVPRNLYYYKDDLDWERKGKETLKYLTGYYYTSHNWKIYYHEVREIVRDYNETDKQFLQDHPDYAHLIPDYNASEVVSDIFTEEQWYVNETPVGSAAWPRETSEIVGERIDHLVNPVVDMVIHMGSMASWLHNSDNSFKSDTSKAYFELYRRGVLYYEKQNITELGHQMFDLIDPVESRKRLSPVTNTPCDTSSETSDALRTRLSTLQGLTHSLVLLTMQGKAALDAELVTALAQIGITTTVHPVGEFNHVILGAVGDTNMIFHEQSITHYYGKGLGYILPIRTRKPDYASIGDINQDTPWVATVRKYRANCDEPTEARNMTLALIDKKYDRYAGVGIHKYLYGSQYTVSMDLNGINPRHHEKTFYYYTLEGAGTSYYPEFTRWWDKRPPLGITNQNIVEREYIGRTEPIDEYRKVIYHIREWLNDGTYRDVEEHSDFFTKWVELSNDSILTIPIDDLKGEYFEDYTISSLERYEFYDGTILTVPRVHTKASLLATFGVESALEVFIDSTANGPYNIKRKLTFTGTRVNDGGSNVFVRTWSATATYTTDKTGPAGALKSTETGTRAIKWGE
jgi:hypothetical protein